MFSFKVISFAAFFCLVAWGSGKTSPSCRVLVEGLPIALPEFVITELKDRTLYVPVGDTEGPVPGWIEKYLSQGKHYRPMMAFLTAGALGKDPSEIRGLSRLLELIHLGSLALDDIIDDADERRGGPPLHIAVGFVGGVVSGPWLQAYVFREAAQITSVPVQTTIANTLMHMGNGEILQDELKRRRVLAGTYSVEEYLQVAHAKTGVLFGLSFSIVPMHLGLSQEFTEKWNRLGQKIGVAYQIKDDFSDAKKEGREINYALLRASLQWGGSPFREITEEQIAELLKAETGNMEKRRQQLESMLQDIESSTAMPLSVTQKASFETIREIIHYVTAL